MPPPKMAWSRTYLRPALFWVHLVCGLGAGAVIAIVAFTGAVLAFEDQINAAFEPDSVPPTAAEISLREPFLPSQLIDYLEQQHPGDRVTSFRMHRDFSRPTSVSLRDHGGMLIHPLTWEPVSRETSRLREFFSLMLQWHRTLAAPNNRDGESPWWNRVIGGNIVAYSTAVLLLLCVTGLYIWWPRNLTRRAFKSITLLKWRLRGHQRDWNWHHAIGLWSALPIAILSLTGLAIVFSPVADFIYPGSAQAPLTITAPSPDAPVAPPDEIYRQIVAEVPDWNYLIFYLPRQHSDGTYIPRPLTIYARTAAWPAQVYNPLRFDPFTGELLQSSAWADRSLMQSLRALNEYVHTGEAFGLIGQTVACLACLATLILVYTGSALTYRRWTRHRAKSS